MLMRKFQRTLHLDLQERRSNHLLSRRHWNRAFVSYIRTLHKEWKEGKFAGDKDYFCSMAQPSWEFGYLDELRKFAMRFRAEIHPYGQPSLGRPKVDRRNWARG